MKKPQPARSHLPEPSDLQRAQRREIVLMITSEDMSLRLKRLKQEGRLNDHQALLDELGDWQNYGLGDLASILHAPYVGSD
ncbi:MAG: hypothetical protein CMN91_02180 [Synechococcus sp. ARS1019]|nr:hypothetical protein [Synechococcus sp. ARS1019]|tara:strand:- start:16089 stop:16331 length:243 start_codon:yes stop_codon:yes gene_type:complete